MHAWWKVCPQWSLYILSPSVISLQQIVHVSSRLQFSGSASTTLSFFTLILAEAWRLLRCLYRYCRTCSCWKISRSDCCLPWGVTIGNWSWLLVSDSCLYSILTEVISYTRYWSLRTSGSRRVHCSELYSLNLAISYLIWARNLCFSLMRSWVECSLFIVSI